MRFLITLFQRLRFRRTGIVPADNETRLQHLAANVLRSKKQSFMVAQLDGDGGIQTTYYSGRDQWRRRLLRRGAMSK